MVHTLVTKLEANSHLVHIWFTVYSQVATSWHTWFQLIHSWFTLDYDIFQNAFKFCLHIIHICFTPNSCFRKIRRIIHILFIFELELFKPNYYKSQPSSHSNHIAIETYAQVIHTSSLYESVAFKWSVDV